MDKGLKYNLIYRSTVIIWLTIKVIFKVYFFLFRHRIWDSKTKQKWEKMLSKTARDYRSKSEKLGGLLIKLGQFLTTRRDILPDTFIQELDMLVDHVKPMPASFAKELIAKEWGTSIDTHLEEMGDAPIASASIGEVYKGKLKNGSSVAIKVQRYRIAEVFHKDFIALRIVFWILKVFTSFGKKADLNALYHELVHVMERELDYEQELEFSNYFKDRYKDNTSIYIPHFYDELSTEKILVMEWIDGTKITDTTFLKKHRINIEQTSKAIFDFYMDQFLNPGKFHADPHSGNILIQKDGTIVVLDFGMVGEIKKKDTEDFKLLVQGLIIENYEIVIEALDQMNFILEDADKQKLKKVLEETVEMYQNQSIKNLDSQAMEQITEEIQTIIQDQPIQLPADYAYLLRAVAIIIGILFAINPQIDIVKWAKPKIANWFGRASIAKSITKQYAKNAADPVLSFPRALLNWLESGVKDREWDKEKHYINLKHQFYLLLEVISFMMVVIGIGIGIYGFHMNITSAGIGGLVGAGIFIVLINVIFVKHYRMIRSRRR